MNREIGTILRLLIFIGAGLVFLILLNLNNRSPTINIINVNFFDNRPLLAPSQRQKQVSIQSRQKCELIFSKMHKLHSTVGHNRPRSLDEMRQILKTSKDNSMPVDKEWVLDQEFNAIVSQPDEFTVANKQINAKIDRVVNNLEYNSFGDFSLEKVFRENLDEEIKSAKIGVLGLYEVTYDPWIESLLYWMSNSTAKISLLDYQKRKYENEAHFKWYNIQTMMSPNDESQLFDILIDYHVSERLGLGRYGEEVTLDADLVTVEMADCMLKPGGLLVLSVSLARDVDSLASYGHIVYNSGRMYGEKRLERMINGWTVRSESVFRYGTVKIYVLQKN